MPNWISNMAFTIAAVSYLAAIVGCLSWQYTQTKGNSRGAFQYVKCGKVVDGFGNVVDMWETQPTPAATVCEDGFKEWSKTFDLSPVEWYQDAWLFVDFSMAFATVGVALTLVSFGHDLFVISIWNKEKKCYKVVIESQKGRQRCCGMPHLGHFKSQWIVAFAIICFNIGWFLVLMYFDVPLAVGRAVVVFIPFVACMFWLAYDLRGATYSSIFLSIFFALLSIGAAIVAMVNPYQVSFPAKSFDDGTMGACICAWDIDFSQRLTGLMGYAMVGIKCLSNAYTWLYMMVASGKYVEDPEGPYCTRFKQGTGLFLLHFSTKIPYHFLYMHKEEGVNDLYEHLLDDLEKREHEIRVKDEIRSQRGHKKGIISPLMVSRPKKEKTSDDESEEHDMMTSEEFDELGLNPAEKAVFNVDERVFQYAPSLNILRGTTRKVHARPGREIEEQARSNAKKASKSKLFGNVVAVEEKRASAVDAGSDAEEMQPVAENSKSSKSKKGSSSHKSKSVVKAEEVVIEVPKRLEDDAKATNSSSEASKKPSESESVSSNE